MNPPVTGILQKPQLGSSKTLEVLLTRLIDYAGLFPPASLGMDAAVANYDQYAQSDFHWMLGRFIVPAVRLGEFHESLGRLTTPDSRPWAVSVLLGANPAADVSQIRTFLEQTRNSSTGRMSVLESVEAKAETPSDVERIAAILPPDVHAYFEIPLAGRERDCIAAVAKCGHRAKIRTGGETADKFPDSAQVINFLRLCAAADVAFKATAGLHHPIRAMHRLTYQHDSPSALMHGFLNLFLAAALVKRGMETGTAIELLDEKSASSIQFDSEGVTWREHRLDWREVAEARRDFSISFGSCSFTEPIDDLRSLGLL